LTEAKEFLGRSETASQATTTSKTTTESNQKVIGSAVAQPPRVSFASTPYALKDSFILDSGSPSHICNSKHRFESNSFQELDVPEPVLTGDDVSYVTGYGDVIIRICTPTGEALFMLKEVAYISGFHTNVVAHKRLRKAGYSWDDINNRLLKDGQVAFYLEERDEQYVIEYNSPKAAFPASATPRPPRDADADRWHLRCGHIGQDALERLMSETYGVRIKGQLTISCEACVRATAKRKVGTELGDVGWTLPFSFWRVSVGQRRTPRSGAAEVSRGEPG